MRVGKAKKTKKRPYMAWWALPFTQLEANGSRPIRVLFIGYHEPSKLDLPAKPTIVFVREGSAAEGAPFPGGDLTRLAAALALCSQEVRAASSARILARLVSGRRRTYRLFDVNKMEVPDAVRLAQSHGDSWEVPYETRATDIRLLKGGYSYSLKKGHTADVHVLLGVGKDVRHNIPVVILRKSWDDYGEAVWLWDGGIRLLAGMQFLANYPPKGEAFSFLSSHEFEMGVSKWGRMLSELPFVEYDPGAPITDTVGRVSI
jgi:hypothetical protein